jgi:hypothetical protein
LQGFFTEDELVEVMRAMGGNPTPQEVEAVMFELDANSDRAIDFGEFMAKFWVRRDLSAGSRGWLHARTAPQWKTQRRVWRTTPCARLRLVLQDCLSDREIVGVFNQLGILHEPGKEGPPPVAEEKPITMTALERCFAV